MSDDLLERASRALKETGEPTSGELETLRAAVLASAAQAKKSRVRVGRWVLPMAAAFVAGTALAATTGQLDRVVRTVDAWLSPPGVEAPPAKAVRATRPPAQVIPAPTQAPEAAALPAAPAAAPEPSVRAPAAESVAPAPSVRAPARRPRRVERSSPGETVPETSTPHAADESASTRALSPSVDARPPAPLANPDLDAYRSAHRTHFGGAAPEVALRAWDRYLESFPTGTFVLEARYNRAVCLVKLGRKREAIDALTPFAEGGMGRGYRRDEARELLRVLTSKP